MKRIRLIDGSGREAVVDERTAKLLISSGKADYVPEPETAPEAAVLRPAPNYMRRRPEPSDR